MKLYSFPTSSASYRVRIVLNLKGVPLEIETVNLIENEQRRPRYRRINPQARIPSLELDDGTILTQSLAIIDYLEQVYPTPSIYPASPALRASALAVALAIASEVQPLNTALVTDYLRDNYGQEESGRSEWMAHWMREGFAAVEQLIEARPFAFGETPTIADVCIVPQVFNARRFKVDIADFPKLVAVDDAAAAIPAFAAAHPSRQTGA
jgi:maleylacetoacetate isomerase